ncbi:hypothetical protein AS29_020725 [Bacillus sp. SJS]|nr:hypothetical protein AS29_020725 [Bacillus sp. SJS]
MEIREIKKDIPIWVIANRLNVHENTLRNWLKKDLSQERKDQIIQAILAIREEIRSEERMS